MLKTRQERKDFLEYTFYVFVAVLFLAMLAHSVGWVIIFKTAISVLGFGAIGALLGIWVKKGKY